jgi:hypothetical protein
VTEVFVALSDSAGRDVPTTQIKTGKTIVLNRSEPFNNEMQLRLNNQSIIVQECLVGCWISALNSVTRNDVLQIL